MYFERPEQMALFRCPDGPDQGVGCAIDGLPDATIFEAGGDQNYVVVGRHPRKEQTTDNRTVEYFYFKRTKSERSGWGTDPEKIVGPLNAEQLEADKARLHLPAFSIVLDDLK
jgi:hypothetical protein